MWGFFLTLRTTENVASCFNQWEYEKEGHTVSPHGPLPWEPRGPGFWACARKHHAVSPGHLGAEASSVFPVTDHICDTGSGSTQLSSCPSLTELPLPPAFSYDPAERHSVPPHCGEQGWEQGGKAHLICRGSRRLLSTWRLRVWSVVFQPRRVVPGRYETNQGVPCINYRNVPPLCCTLETHVKQYWMSPITERNNYKNV